MGIQGARKRPPTLNTEGWRAAAELLKFLEGRQGQRGEGRKPRRRPLQRSWLVSQAGGEWKGEQGEATLSLLWLGCGFAHDLRYLLAPGCPPGTGDRVG